MEFWDFRNRPKRKSPENSAYTRLLAAFPPKYERGITRKMGSNQLSSPYNLQFAMHRHVMKLGSDVVNFIL